MSMVTLNHVLSRSGSLLEGHNINFQKADVSKARTTDPFTHIYMFDLAFEEALLSAIATAFHNRYFLIVCMFQMFIFIYEYIIYIFSTVFTGCG